MVAVDIFPEVLAIGDHFLSERGVPGMMGVFGIIGLLNGEFGRDEIGVLIHNCQMRMEIGSGFSSSKSDPCSMGSVSPACSSSE
jgi:hypothetical protein